MAGYSSGSMLNQNNQDFPNNNSGQITPAILRTFNANLINSVQFTDVATPTASFALTASNIFPAITNNVDNYILTATGNGTINGESNLAFDGTTLTVTVCVVIV